MRYDQKTGNRRVRSRVVATRPGGCAHRRRIPKMWPSSSSSARLAAREACSPRPTPGGAATVVFLRHAWQRFRLVGGQFSGRIHLHRYTRTQLAHSSCTQSWYGNGNTHTRARAHNCALTRVTKRACTALYVRVQITLARDAEIPTTIRAVQNNCSEKRIACGPRHTCLQGCVRRDNNSFLRLRTCTKNTSGR